jgi:hypothetical protein
MDFSFIGLVLFASPRMPIVRFLWFNFLRCAYQNAHGCGASMLDFRPEVSWSLDDAVDRLGNGYLVFMLSAEILVSRSQKVIDSIIGLQNLVSSI